MREDTPQIVTAGLIAGRLGVAFHRVQHILRSRPHIRPLARAGHTRLYAHEAIEAVRREIEKIDSRGLRR